VFILTLNACVQMLWLMCFCKCWLCFPMYLL